MSPRGIRPKGRLRQDLRLVGLSLLLLPVLANSSTAEVLFQPARLDLFTSW